MSVTHRTSPREDGFRMPGQHEPHRAVLMAWPDRPQEAQKVK
jgi:agmatine deiminase